MHELPKFKNSDMLVGTETGDDAGVYRLRPDLAIVNTVDFFTPIVDDPYIFGQISAANSLSDVYAMGGDPVTCMNIVCFPKGKMDIEILGEILKGGAEKVKESGAVVIGGHSIIDEEIKFGMAVTGVIHPDKIFRNVGVQEGDVLILTKALGTGIITTALKKGKASDESVERGGEVDDDAECRGIDGRAQTLGARLLRCHRLRHPRPRPGDGQRQRRHSGDRVGEDAASASAPRAWRKRATSPAAANETENISNDKMAIDKSIREGLIEVALDPQTSGGLLLADRQTTRR